VARSGTPSRRPAALWSRDRQADAVRPLAHLLDRVPEPDLAAIGDQRFGQPLDQLVLRIDVMRPPAGQRCVVEHRRTRRRPELAPVILGAEFNHGPGDAFAPQLLHGAVFDQSRLGPGAEISLGLPFHQDEWDAFALQQVGGDQSGRAGAHDNDVCSLRHGNHHPILPYRHRVRLPGRPHPPRAGHPRSDGRGPLEQRHLRAAVPVAETVETHVGSIFSKLGLLPAAGDHRRVLAVLTYIRSA
jgi:hypothetical protein